MYEEQWGEFTHSVGDHDYHANKGEEAHKQWESSFAIWNN